MRNLIQSKFIYQYSGAAFLIALLATPNSANAISTSAGSKSIVSTPINFVVVCKRVRVKVLWWWTYKETCPITPTIIQSWNSTTARAVVTDINKKFYYGGYDHDFSGRTRFANFYLGRYVKAYNNGLYNINSNNEGDALELLRRSYGRRGYVNVFITNSVLDYAGFGNLNTPLFNKRDSNRDYLYGVNLLYRDGRVARTFSGPELDLSKNPLIANGYDSLIFSLSDASSVSKGNVLFNLANGVAHEMGHNIGFDHYADGFEVEVLPYGGSEFDYTFDHTITNGPNVTSSDLGKLCGITDRDYWKKENMYTSDVRVVENSKVRCQHNHVMSYISVLDQFWEDPIRIALKFPDILKCGDESGLPTFFTETGFRRNRPDLSSYGRKSQETMLCWNYLSHYYDKDISGGTYIK